MTISGTFTPNTSASMTSTSAVSASAVSASDIRVEKGHAEPEEVAAITALLLARATAAPVSAHRAHGVGRTRAPWRRLDREPGFRAPHSWH